MLVYIPYVHPLYILRFLFPCFFWSRHFSIADKWKGIKGKATQPPVSPSYSLVHISCSFLHAQSRDIDLRPQWLPNHSSLGIKACED